MIVPLVYASFSLVFLGVPALSFPVSLISDDESNHSNENIEIIKGPREFLVPLVPLRDLVLPRNVGKGSNQESPVTKVTDLDYMLYGKLYLIKALNTAETRTGFRQESFDVVHSPRNKPETDSSTSAKSYNEGISFPGTSKPTKRPYRYKVWSKLGTHNDGLSNSGHLGHRKMEERSADQMDSTTQSEMFTSLPPTTATVTDSKTIDNDTVNFDEEALELLQKLIPPPSPQTNDETSNDGEIQGSITDSNSTTDNIDIGDRFLINVPTKPNFTQCPEGQKRNHRGVCKSVFVHKPSPNDGFFAGRLYTANGTQRKDLNRPLMQHGRKEDVPNLQWTSLFRSVVQLEKRLEKTIREAEKQLSASTMVQDEGTSSSTATTDETKQT